MRIDGLDARLDGRMNALGGRIDALGLYGVSTRRFTR